MISMVDKYWSRGKIGGPGHMVEIDHLEIASTIHTDCWRGINALMIHGYAAHMTNHSHHFVDSVTGIHTNSIESQWRLSLLIKQISNKG